MKKFDGIRELLCDGFCSYEVEGLKKLNGKHAILGWTF